MIDLDELERMLETAAEPEPSGDDSYYIVEPFKRMEFEQKLDAALRNAAPELIAMARQADEIHTAICSAVSHLNICPELARSENGRTAHLILRQALIDYADAMQEQKR